MKFSIKQNIVGLITVEKFELANAVNETKLEKKLMIETVGTLQD